MDASFTSLQSLQDEDTIAPDEEQQHQQTPSKKEETLPSQGGYNDSNFDGWGIIDDYEEESISDKTCKTDNQQDEVNTVQSDKTSII